MKPINPDKIRSMEAAADQGGNIGYELSAEGLAVLQHEISLSQQKMDASWFLTEETRKTRERFLYISAFSTAVLATNVANGVVNLTWPAEMALSITNRAPIDLSLFAVTIAIGVNYLISARSELAKHVFSWNVASSEAETVQNAAKQFSANLSELLETNVEDAPFAPEVIRPRLNELNRHVKITTSSLKKLNDRNRSIVWWGERMPYLTFAIPILIMVTATFLRQ